MAGQLHYGKPEEAGMSAERIRRLADRARQWVDGGLSRALVLLAARRGTIVLHEAYGTLTPEADSPPV